MCGSIAAHPSQWDAAESSPTEFTERFPGVLDLKVLAAERINLHKFDFLGTGSANWGDTIDWHRDVKSGYRWPVKFYTEYGQDLMPGEGVDVKVPWELSRFHHLVALGQAWWLTAEQRHADEFFLQWESWLEANPWLYGVHWTYAMEVAIRAVNLLWTAALLSEAPGWSEKRKAALARSLWQHGVFIENNLEVGAQDGRIVAGNHYLANVCGLACLGLCSPELPGAVRWRRVGLKALEQEIRRQVLPDGFFYEASTSYHRLALELFLVPALLARRAGHEMSDTYWATLERMLEVILYLTRPDDQLPQIGDNDDGRLLILSGYPDWPRHDHRYLLALGAVLFQRGDFKAAAGACLEEVFWLLGREGVEAFELLPSEPKPLSSRSFPDGGLYVIRSQDDQDYALVRTGVPSSHAITAHAHNDALSIELWLWGEPVLVDPGTYCYSSNLRERDRLRSTVSHSTVMVAGQEINRIPGNDPFRLEQDAKIRVLEWYVGEERIRLVVDRTTEVTECPRARHQRTVTYSTSSPGEFQIEDEIEPGNGSLLYWQLPARAELRIDDSSEAICQIGSTCLKIVSDVVVDASLLPVHFAPAFGCKTDGKSLRLALADTSCARVKTSVYKRSPVQMGQHHSAAFRSEDHSC